MYQLLSPQSLREMPALADDRSARESEAQWPCYRSEAFAEDLGLVEASSEPAAPARRATMLMLWAAPVAAALFGGALALFGAAA